MSDNSLLTIPMTAKVTRTKTTFQQHDQQIIINAPGSLMQQLVTLCDGAHTQMQIIDSLTTEWDRDCVVELVDELIRLGILVDPKYICEDLWQYAMNPSRYARAVSDQEAADLAEKAWERHKASTACKYYTKSMFSLGCLLEDRCSTRHFSELPVEMQTIVDMLWAGYGECKNNKRTVPSAGALYPIVLYLALMRSSGELSPGVYRVNISQMWSIGFEIVSEDVAKFQRAFMDPLMAEKAHGAVVIGGSLHQTAEKYGNRSMLYVPLEAGHVAQNIHLAAYSHDLATVEIGGFAEDMLRKACEMPDEYMPMTTILFGQPSSKKVIDTTGVSEVEWVMPITKSYQAPFAIAQARVSAELNEDWSYGRDSSPAMALTKAVSEAKEWAACGCVPEELLNAQLKDVPNAIDPRTIIRFHESQYKLTDFPLEPFDEKIAYEWVEGRDELTGESKYLLADLVYFPYFGETTSYLFANSSGVAAHPDLQQAIESSVLELIERDSFMIAYLTGLKYPTISVGSLPQGLQKRISKLQQEGFEITIKDHTLDLAPVITVFAQNEALAYTNCASCSRFEIESAINHALMEVEASVLARLQNGPAAALKPSDVAMPLQHGALYEQKRYFRRADFMFKGVACATQEPFTPADNWNGLLDKLQQMDVPLITTQFFLSEQYGGNGDLHIVRSIIPGLVPMTFGYRQEPGGMKRLYDVARQKGKCLTYGNIRKFPHPFA